MHATEQRPTTTAIRPQAGHERPARWPLLGVAAGVCGAIASLATDLHPRGLEPPATVSVLSDVDRRLAHAGVAFGYLTVALLLVVAAAWRRHVGPRTTDSTASHVVPMALTAAASSLALGYGWKGALAVYLPGGMDDREFDRTALYVYYVLNDFGSFIGWIGVAVAAGAVAWMSLRDRSISRWIGAVSLVPPLAVVVTTASTGLPGFAAVVTPLWTVIAFTGLALGRSPITQLHNRG